VANDVSILGRGVGAGVRKGDDELRAALNRGIATIVANGTYDEITARYFETSIYGS
jgi:polar amino acid transport system substrate-binding protein